MCASEHLPLALDPAAEALIAAMPDGVVLVESGRIVLVNAELERLTGFDHDALLGMPVEELVPRARVAEHGARRREFEAAPQVRPLDHDLLLAMRCADGRELPVEVALAPLRLADRDLTLATVRDVAARRRGEAERRRLVEILDLLPDLIIVAEEGTGRVLAVNRAAARHLGQEAVRRRRSPWGHAGREVRHTTLQAADGSTLECEVRSSVVTVKGGDRVVVNILRDVGDVLALRSRLLRTERSFRAVFEQAPVGIAVTRIDAAGRREVVRANPAFTAMFGYAPGELDGQDPALLRVGEGEDQGEDEPDDEAWLPHPLAATGTLPTATAIRRYRRPDGSRLWAEVRATALEGMPGGDRQFLVHAVDVTQRVEAERSAYRHALVTQIVAAATTAAIDRPCEAGVLELIATGAAEVLDADAVAVLSDDPSAGAGYRWSATFGPLAEALTASVDAAGGATLLERAARDGAVPLPQLPGRAGAGAPEVGPVLLAPFGQPGLEFHGGLVAARAPGGRRFTSEDAERLSRLATQTQAAAHFARGRADQERVALLEERQRIARELHDTVIQDVIAVGMVLSAEADRESDPARAARILENVSRLEAAAGNLRTAVFELRTDARRGSLSAGVSGIVDEASRVLGFFPTVTFSGPVDGIADGLAEDLVGALREALANVARHSRATACAVSISVSEGTVELVVEDNGVGAGPGSRAGYGLGYLEERARRHGGRLTLGTGPVAGTRLVWSCPRGTAALSPEP